MGFVGSAAMGLPMATGASAPLPDQVVQRFETALDRGLDWGLDWGLDRGLGGEDCSAVARLHDPDGRGA